ncbi:MAG: Pyridoxine 4-dehydrogenase [Icmadophila ericetorum]|nr:Pyridoxine 4-dehydrogenase [Icmadophila ericetorum]
MANLTRPDKPISFEKATAVLKSAINHNSNFWNAALIYGTPAANSLHLVNHYFLTYPTDTSKVVISVKGAFNWADKRPDCSLEGFENSVSECEKILVGISAAMVCNILGQLKEWQIPTLFELSFQLSCLWRIKYQFYAAHNHYFTIVISTILAACGKKIDFFEAARIDKSIPIEETIRNLTKFVSSGRIRGIGLSEVSAKAIRRAAAIPPIACVEIELSLFSTDVVSNSIVDTYAELGIPLVAYCPLGRGWLTGELKAFSDIPKGDFCDTCPVFNRLSSIRMSSCWRRLKLLQRGRVALAWAKKQKGIVIPIPGTTNPARLEENVKEVSLTEEEMHELSEILERWRERDIRRE